MGTERRQSLTAFLYQDEQYFAGLHKGTALTVSGQYSSFRHADPVSFCQTSKYPTIRYVPRTMATVPIVYNGDPKYPVVRYFRPLGRVEQPLVDSSEAGIRGRKPS